MSKIYDINIDYLRGILALYIVLYHLLSWNSFIVLNGTSIFLKLAFYFVSIFFIISGYALTLSAINQKYNFKNRWDVFYYFQRRFARIYPLFILVILLAVLIEYRNINTVRDLFYQITITFNIFNKNGLTPASWSIGVEIIFYLLFPLLYMIILFIYKTNIIYSNILLIFSIVIFIIMSSYNNYYSKYPQAQYFSIYVHNFFNHIYFFLIGMFFALNRTSLFSIKEKKYIKTILIFLFIFFILWKVNYTHLYWNYLYGTNRIVLSLSSISLFLLFLLFFNFKGFFERSLNTLGKISYTIYLMHPIFIYIYEIKIHKINNFLHLIFSIVFIIILSIIVYYYYEDPLRKLINNLKVHSNV